MANKTSSGGIFGAGLVLFLVALVAGIWAGKQGIGDTFDYTPFAALFGAGLVAFAVCYAASVIVEHLRD